MDHLGVLDLRYGKRSTSLSSEFSSQFASIVGPLDLRTSRYNEPEKRKGAHHDEPKEHSLQEVRPSVITPNMQFTSANQRSRWNHRSHPSIDSDSSFESEQESDLSHPGSWYPVRNEDTIDVNLTEMHCSSIVSFKRRQSMSSPDQPDLAHTDTENDSEACESISMTSSGFYKELPALTANVSIGQREQSNMILELSSCQAELIDPADVESELIKTKNNHTDNEEESDEMNDNTLQICETETYFEELLSLQTNQGSDTTETSLKITSGIQETATNFIKEIRKTKSDMYSSGLNLEMDGNKKQYCMKCNDEFYSIAALLKHLMTHSSRNPGEKLIKCPVCTKRFSTLSTLENHMLRLHTGDMKFVCEMCDAPFKFGTHLRKHMVSSRCGKGIKKASKGQTRTTNSPFKSEEKAKSVTSP